MMSMSVRRGSAQGPMTLWRIELVFVYATMILLTCAVICSLINLVSINTSASKIRHQQPSFQQSVQPLIATARAAVSSKELQLTCFSLLLALALCRYLHLKISIPANARDRLATLRDRIVPESQKKDYQDFQNDHDRLGEMLLASQVISREELQQALDLSRATHRLLGDCLVSFGWLTQPELEKALSAQELFDCKACQPETVRNILNMIKQERQNRHGIAVSRYWHNDDGGFEQSCTTETALPQLGTECGDAAALSEDVLDPADTSTKYGEAEVPPTNVPIAPQSGTEYGDETAPHVRSIESDWSTDCMAAVSAHAETFAPKSPLATRGKKSKSKRATSASRSKRRA